MGNKGEREGGIKSDSQIAGLDKGMELEEPLSDIETLKECWLFIYCLLFTCFGEGWGSSW